MKVFLVATGRGDEVVKLTVNNQDQMNGLWKSIDVSYLNPQGLPLDQDEIVQVLVEAKWKLTQEAGKLEDETKVLAGLMGRGGETISDTLFQKSQELTAKLRQETEMNELLDSWLDIVSPPKPDHLKPKASQFSAISPTSILVTKLSGEKVFAYDGTPLPKMETYVNKMYTAAKKDTETVENGISYLNHVNPAVITYAEQAMKCRKHAFMRRIDVLIKEDDYKQVVLVANGYNPMAVALAEKHPSVAFCCTDMDQNVVRECTDIFNDLKLDNIDYVWHQVKENDPVMERVRHGSFGGLDGKTLVAIEGLTYYITESEERELITGILDDHPGNAILFDFADEEELKDSDNPHVGLQKKLTDTVKGLIVGPSAEYTYRASTVKRYYEMLDQQTKGRNLEIVSPTHIAREAAKVDNKVLPEYWDKHDPCGKVALIF